MASLFLTVSSIRYERKIIFLKDGVAWAVFMERKWKKGKQQPRWSCSCSQWGSPIRAENNLYLISPIFRKLPWTQGWLSGQLCPEMPEAMAISAPLSAAPKMKHSGHSFKGVKAWNQALPHFPLSCTAFCFPCLPLPLSVPWFWQFFKCLLKELWQPGRESWNTYLGRLYLEVKKAKGKNNCIQKPWESGLDNVLEKNDAYMEVHLWTDQLLVQAKVPPH